MSLCNYYNVINITIEISVTSTLKQIPHGHVPVSTGGISFRDVRLSYAQLEVRRVGIVLVKVIKI